MDGTGTSASFTTVAPGAEINLGDADELEVTGPIALSTMGPDGNATIVNATGTIPGALRKAAKYRLEIPVCGRPQVAKLLDTNQALTQDLEKLRAAPTNGSDPDKEKKILRKIDRMIEKFGELQV